MINTKNILENINSSGLIGKMLSGMATKNFAAGLLTGGVTTSIFGGKDTVEAAAKLGGIALLGTLAYKAYNNYQQKQISGTNNSVIDSLKASATDMLNQAGSTVSGFIPNNIAQNNLNNTQPEFSNNNELALSIIRAMIGAAKADGHMDSLESEKIISQLEAAGIGNSERIFLIQEMANTQNPDIIAASAKNSQEAAQIYLAALLVCNDQCKKEQEYLHLLANALKLEPSFTADLHNEILNLSQSKAA